MNRIPCISLWQPWASLWAGGAKLTETRTWPLTRTLPLVLAVHAAKRPLDEDTREECYAEPFRSALKGLGYARPSAMPLGAVVGLVRVVRVYQFSNDVPPPPLPDRAFGNFEPGRWGWVADAHRLFEKPVPQRGCQGLFWWTPPEGLDVSL